MSTEMETAMLDSKVFRQSSIPTKEELTSTLPPVAVDIHSSKYDMNKKYRGHAIVFNHYKFQSPFFMDQHGSDRKGTHVDKNRLYDTLTQLGFDVTICEDLKANEIKDKLKEVADMDHTDNDCIVVVVLTHGVEDKLRAKDRSYKENKLWKPFFSCRSLIGKPKLFFIQACRGEFRDEGNEAVHVSVDELVHEIGQDEIDASPFQTNYRTFSVPTTADLLIMHSTYIGHFSFRKEESGTCFIQKLCDELDENGNTQDLLELLTSVCRHVGYGFQSHAPKTDLHRLKQMPCIISTLTKKLIFSQKGENLANENRH